MRTSDTGGPGADDGSRPASRAAATGEPRWRRRALPGLLVFLLGCSSGADTAMPPLEILLQPSDGSGAVGVAVGGLAADDLERLRAAELTDDEWSSLFRVTVTPSDDRDDSGALPAVLGRYSVGDDGVRFVPMFPFDPGRDYTVSFTPTRLPGREETTAPPLIDVVALPRPDVEPTTVVERIFPSGDRIPENQLKLYLHFSAPMSAVDGLEYLSLRDDRGRPVEAPFLPLGTEFWDLDRLRYTVFFDPGRIKQGLDRNEQLGRPLEAGQTYTLVVDAAWPDAEGNPLQAPFEKQFTVGPADTTPLDTATWRLRVPSAGSRQRLVVSFPEPLDHALMRRTIGVENAEGDPVRGTVETGNWETRWMLTPAAAWEAGAYSLVARTILEDLAGNQIGTPFEIDVLARVEDTSPGDQVRVEFEIR